MKDVTKRIISILCIIFLVTNCCAFATEVDKNKINENDVNSLVKSEETEEGNEEQIKNQSDITESAEKEKENVNKDEKESEIEEEQEENKDNDENNILEKENDVTKSVEKDKKLDDKEVKEEKEEKEEKQEDLNIELESTGDGMEELVSSEIKDGIYAIKSVLNPNLVMDVSSASYSNSANIQLWSNACVKQQRFKIKKLVDNYYSITAEHSGKSFDVQGAGKLNGTNLQQYEANGTDAQQWIIKYEENGEYSIISKCNGLFLDIYNGIAVNGANIQLFQGNGTKAQRFILERMDLPEQNRIENLEDGDYIISSVLNEKMVMDVSAGSNANTANIQIWENAGVTQQIFKIKYVNGFYSIISKKSGKSLDVQEYGIKSCTNVQQYDYSGNDAQKWIIKEIGNDCYSIVSKYNGLYIDICGGSASNGTNVQLYEGNGSDAQIFKLKKIGVSYQQATDLEEGRYIVRSKLDNNKVFDISAASKDSGANVQIWNSCHGLQQQFDLKFENGFYSIKNVNSGKSLEATDAIVTSGANVYQNEYRSSENQQWIIQKNDDNTYSIVSKLSGLYVDIYGGISDNGTNVQLYEGNGTNAQKFFFDKVEQYVGEKIISDGTYRIKSSINGMSVLDVSAGSTFNNANIQIWQNAGVLQQHFNIRYVGDGYYSIIAVNSGKALDVECCGNTNGTNIQQYDYNNNDAQKWIINKENNQYKIISKVNNLFLTVADGSGDNGTNVCTWEDKNDLTQCFILEKTESKSEKSVMDGTFEIATTGNNNFVVDVSGGSTDDYANIQMWERNGTKAQKFSLEYVDGAYLIKNPNSDKFLTVDESGNVIQRELNNSTSQKWIIKKDINYDGYNIISIYNEKYLQVSSNLVAGTNVNVGNESSKNNQSFRFLSKKYTIVINPGHGGVDTGCVGYISTLLEKNITLKIAQYLRDELNKSLNYHIILTHEGLGDDGDLSLADRAEIARRNNADVYVSLHINAEPSNTASGSMMFVPYYEGQKHYNSSMSRLGNLMQGWLEKIGIQKYTTSAITKRCETETPRYQYTENGVVVQADYYADLRYAMKGNTDGYGDDLTAETGIPAILVEHCFINTDTRFVNTDEALKKIAEADANAIREYFGTY